MAAEKGRRARMAPVRQGDIEPYTALRWVSTLFKGAAVFLGVAVVAETIAGLTAMGFGVLPQLLGEVVRTAVFAVVLWGAGDLVRLLIHLGHDIRAERILLTRIAMRMGPERDGDRRPFGPGPGPARPPEAEAAD
jgi:hypothetical protein